MTEAPKQTKSIINRMFVNVHVRRLFDEMPTVRIRATLILVRHSSLFYDEQDEAMEVHRFWTNSLRSFSERSVRREKSDSIRKTCPLHLFWPLALVIIDRCSSLPSDWSFDDSLFCFFTSLYNSNQSMFNNKHRTRSSRFSLINRSTHNVKGRCIVSHSFSGVHGCFFFLCFFVWRTGNFVGKFQVGDILIAQIDQSKRGTMRSLHAVGARSNERLTCDHPYPIDPNKDQCLRWRRSVDQWPVFSHDENRETRIRCPAWIDGRDVGSLWCSSSEDFSKSISLCCANYSIQRLEQYLWRPSRKHVRLLPRWILMHVHRNLPVDKTHRTFAE